MAISVNQRLVSIRSGASPPASDLRKGHDITCERIDYMYIRLLSFIIGIVLIIVGAVILLQGALHGASTLANVVGVLFTVFGAIINLVQLYFPMPILPPHQIPSTPQPDPLPFSPPRKEANIPQGPFSGDHSSQSGKSQTISIEDVLRRVSTNNVAPEWNILYPSNLTFGFFLIQGFIFSSLVSIIFAAFAYPLMYVVWQMDVSYPELSGGSPSFPIINPNEFSIAFFLFLFILTIVIYFPTMYSHYKRLKPVMVFMPEGIIIGYLGRKSWGAKDSFIDYSETVNISVSGVGFSVRLTVERMNKQWWNRNQNILIPLGFKSPRKIAEYIIATFHSKVG